MNEEDGTDFDAGRFAHGYTTVAAARAYAAASEADALAIAIGNAHGIYKGIPSLDFERLEEIAGEVDIPLVLHGSSGIPQKLLQRAIQLGIRKVNIDTELSTTGIKASRDFLAGHTDSNTRFETMTKAAETEMAKVVRDYVRCFAMSGCKD